MITMNETDLAERYARLKEAKSNLRIRDAAKELGVSEAELVALNVGNTATRLRGKWGDFMKRIPELGRCMALTRNEAAVHERKGVYNKPEIFGPMGQVLGEDIDLRLLLMHWHIGYAVRDEVDGETRRSFQIFDKFGGAIHKIYPQESSSAEAFEKIASDFADENQSTAETFEPTPGPAAEPNDDDVDAAAFQQAWDALTDTHEFHGMVRKFGLGRQQALRIAGDERAYQVKPNAAREVLEQASKSGRKIMIFVGNRGNIQIHSGKVENIKTMGPWLNVLDPDFNLHLREDMIANAWVVKKPTRNGQVTSLELFDPNGENISLFFSKRIDNEPEKEDWRELLGSLSKN